MSSPHRVTIVGATISGMATAVRLAKRGHTVSLVVPEASEDALVAQASAVFDADATLITFPAPWRDLFKKSGRALDVELTRVGLDLVPAPGLELDAGGAPWRLPAERGAQFAAIEDRHSTRVAERWRDLLDGLDGVWQHRRRLGMEFEFTRSEFRRARVALWTDRTVADLAADLPDDLAELVRSTAETVPEESPAVDAVTLATYRRFGTWHLVRRNAPADPLPARELVTLLASRLSARRVTITDSTPSAADAIVTAEPVDPIGAWYRRPGPRVRRLGHRRRNRYQAGVHTTAGTGHTGELLSAALAAYAVHLDLTGEDIHPSVK